MLAVPLAKLAVGVNIAVRVRPVPLMALSEPPVASTSPTVPFQAKLLPGSSENEKVIVAVSPIFKALVLLLISTEGAKVSMLMLDVLPAAPLLPAASW